MNPIRRSFRLVCAPHEVSVIEDMLRLQGYMFEKDPFFLLARRLTEEPKPLGSSLAAFFGLIYIQDRASMLPPVALCPPQGAAVLDMCASPGSKTGQLAGMVGQHGFVLGNEPSPSRLATLRRNLHTMGLAQTATICQSGEALPLPEASATNAAWHHIQLDPPCSGWGTVERNPRVMDIWKDNKVMPLIQLQRALLREAVRLLQPGGELVYSTCTTNIEENEEQVDYAVNELGLLHEALASPLDFALDKPMASRNHATPWDGVWRLSPRPGDTQGFFVARLRKPCPQIPGVEKPTPVASTNSTALSEPTASRFATLSASALLEVGVDPKQLPGSVGIFGDSLHVLPDQALTLLPEVLRWQGMYFGKYAKNGDIQLSPRLRLPPPPAHPIAIIDFEGTAGLQALQGLLTGQSMPCDAQGKTVILRWNGLILGRARLKNRRLLWTER